MSDEYRLVYDAPEHGAWSRAWSAAGLGDVAPDRWELMRARPERALRFHLLPDDREFLDDAGDRHELLRRHGVVLDRLGGPDVLLALVHDARLDAGRRWRTWRRVDPPHDLTVDIVDPAPSGVELEGQLLHIAEGEPGHPGMLLAAADFAWTYMPYPGGVDITARDAEQLDELLDALSPWLPPANRRDHERAAWRFVELLDHLHSRARAEGEAGLGEGLSALMAEVRRHGQRSGRWHGIDYEQHGMGFRLWSQAGAVDVDLHPADARVSLRVDPWKVVMESRHDGRQMTVDAMAAVLVEDVVPRGRLARSEGLLLWPGPATRH